MAGAWVGLAEEKGLGACACESASEFPCVFRCQVPKRGVHVSGASFLAGRGSGSRRVGAQQVLGCGTASWRGLENRVSSGDRNPIPRRWTSGEPTASRLLSTSVREGVRLQYFRFGCY